MNATGFWRRIVLDVSAGVVDAAIEDDAHHFELRLIHADGRVTRVEPRTVRAPWSTCSDAGAVLAGQLAGSALEEVGRRDPSEHCTHLLDLAIVAAAHADAPGRHRFDLQVPDRVDGTTAATIAKDDRELLRWDLDGSAIMAPPEWAGRDLARFVTWKGEIAPNLQLNARMLRRAVLVSGVRRWREGQVRRASDYGGSRQGVCFTHQPAVATRAEWVPGSRREFSDGRLRPLEDRVTRIPRA